MRTLEEFVADMTGRGKTPGQVRAVAINSRWETQAGDAEVLAEAFGAEWESLGREERVNKRMSDSVRRRVTRSTPRRKLLLKKS